MPGVFQVHSQNLLDFEAPGASGILLLSRVKVLNCHGLLWYVSHFPALMME